MLLRLIFLLLLKCVFQFPPCDLNQLLYSAFLDKIIFLLFISFSSLLYMPLTFKFLGSRNVLSKELFSLFIESILTLLFLIFFYLDLIKYCKKRNFFLFHF